MKWTPPCYIAREGIRVTRYINYPGKRWGVEWIAVHLPSGKQVSANTKKAALARLRAEIQ